MLPLFVDLTDRVCVVVGGGPVGRRKAQALLAANAIVRLVCLEPAALTAERLIWLTEPYQADHLAGASLAVAAATPEVNTQVLADARRRHVWVNSAYNPGAGDFFLPSVVRRGDLVLAIGTHGAAPALCRQVRERLEQEFDDDFEIWVRLLAEMRPQVLSMISSTDGRRAILRRLSDWSWLERLRQDGEAAVRSAMQLEIRQAGGVC